MPILDQHSKAIIEFSLSWNDGDIRHTDRYWADPVSLWRDCLDRDLCQKLLGQGIGGSAEINIPANRFSQPYSPNKIIRIRPEQFRGVDRYGNNIALQKGRFYPQGQLSEVNGVFRVTSAPCRFLGRQDEQLVFDLNHPLAGHDLHLQATIKDIHPQIKERGGRCEDWLERISLDGPGMQARISNGVDGFIPENFRRRDENPDNQFYRSPRLVHHLDSTARQELRRVYASLIPSGAKVLDLMASWTSHLPEDLTLDGLTVLGMNEEELRQNSRATQTVLHDLNALEKLPFADESFDAAICTASVEYLTRPLAAMTELRRILRHGGLLVFAFSNRWFPPKAVRIWSELHEFERVGLIVDLFVLTEGFKRIATMSRRGLPRPSDDPHQESFFSDPLYIVWGYKN